MTVYTAITGEYDIAKNLEYKAHRYEIFTDNDHIHTDNKVHFYKKLTGRNAVLMARKVKILSHKYIKAKYTLWIDGSFMIAGDLNEFRHKMKGDMLLIKHPQKNCVYAEMRTCMDNRRDDWDILKSQYMRYKREGFPEGYGLIASGVMLRKDTPQVRALMELWWKEVSKGSIRDQCSFTYALWKLKNKPKIDYIDYTDLFTYLKFTPHGKRSNYESRPPDAMSWTYKKSSGEL